VADNKVAVGSGTGTFSHQLNISAFSGVTTVYVRGYATSSVGTGYGAETSFVTLPGLPNLSMDNVSDINSTTATLSAEVIGDGGASVTSRGFVYSTANATPSLSDNLGNISMGNGTGEFFNVFNISGFMGGLTIYVRAYAINSQGTVYSSVNSFNVPPKAPSVGWTQLMTSITATGASGIGNVTNENGASVTSRGFCYSISSTPTINDNVVTSGTGSGTFSITLTGLAPATTYYVRSFATNSAGTSYSSMVDDFTTLSDVPSVSTEAVTFPEGTFAYIILNGEATAANGQSITAHGIVYSLNPANTNPTVGNGDVMTRGSGLGEFNYELNITGTSPGTVVYYRAWAQNSLGYGYGEVISHTIQKLPILASVSASNLTKTSVTVSSSVTNNGGTTVIARGFVYKINDGGPNPTLENATVVYVGSGDGSFSTDLTGLQPGTNYLVRAFATNSLGTEYTSNNGVITPIEVGDVGPAGGIVFYDKGNYNGGWRYLEAAPVEAESDLTFGCDFTHVQNTSTGVSAGEENTQLIIWNGCNSPASSYCYNLAYNGFDDWFLPSRDELSYMYTNLKLNNLGDFSETLYWSSSEFSDVISYNLSMLDGGSGQFLKSNQFKVRPVRGF